MKIRVQETQKTNMQLPNRFYAAAKCSCAVKHKQEKKVFVSIQVWQIILIV